MKIGLRHFGLRGLAGAAFLIEIALAHGAAPMVGGGQAHSIALDRAGTVYAWGGNKSGQLGDGTNNYSPSPIVVPGLVFGFASVAGGGDSAGFSLAARSDGAVFAWGYNAEGELGLGNTNPGPLSPTQIPAFSNVLTVTAGHKFAAALKKDGTVWAWGDNFYGQLGKGDKFPSSSPLQVPGLSNIVKLCAGDSHLLALRSDGAVFAWGQNFFGQIGDGTTSDALVPYHVASLPATVVDIGTSTLQSYAVLADGSVYGWGNDNVGQMGDLATPGNRTTPVRALGFLPRIVKLGCSAGGQAISAHSLDGRLWKWGFNNYGQLGDGGGPNTAVPQILAQASNLNVMYSFAGFQQQLVRADGAVRGWGSNAYGPGEAGTTLTPTVNVLIPAPVLGLGGTGNLNLGNYAGRKSNFNNANADGWLFWRYPSLGANTLWRIQGNAVVTNQALTGVGPTWTVAGTGDINGDGVADVVWVEAGGAIVVWEMNGTSIASSAVIGTVPAGWSLVAVGDINGDGKDDLVFRSNTGVVAAWIMDGAIVRNVDVIGSMATSYQLAWLGDFDGNGIKDILWFNPATGSAVIWELFETPSINVWNLGTLGPGWTPAVVGDFNGDGRTDILWRNGSTSVVWYMAAGVAEKTQLMPTVDTSWQPVAVLDASGAGRDDIIWLNSGGSVVRWQMQGIDQTPSVAVIAVQGTGWQVVGQH